MFYTVTATDKTRYFETRYTMVRDFLGRRPGSRVHAKYAKYCDGCDFCNFKTTRAPRVKS